jgi:hypothetical protein
MSTGRQASGQASRFPRVASGTAQLQREIIESASADEVAPSIDLNTFVHMLLSDTRPEFTGDMPTKTEMARLERDVPKMGLEETLEYAKTIIPNLARLPTLGLHQDANGWAIA